VLKRKKFLNLLIIFVLGTLLISWGKSAIKTLQGSSQLKQLQNDLAESTAKIENLEGQLKSQQTEEYIEEQARNKLNLIKPGEKAVVLGQKQNQDSDLPAEADLPQKNWEKWRYLFLRF
jgi:cell division protein FtsB